MRVISYLLTILIIVAINITSYYAGYNCAFNNVLNTNELLNDSSYKYLDGHKIDLPEEISCLPNYDNDSLTLLAAFIDDGGIIRLQFSGHKIARKEIVDTTLDISK